MDRAVDLLVALAEAPRPLDLSTLARRVGLHSATTFRMLETLAERGLVRHTPDGWLLGALTFELGSAFARGVSVWASGPQHIEELASRVNETASLGILDSGEVLYIAIAHGQRELGIQSQPGTRHPAHATALGKVLLAALPWPEVVALLQRRPPVALTERTRTSLDEIRAELERVTKLGYAIDDEERAPGVYCVGAPVCDHTGAVVAAVSVSGPTFRMTGAEREGIIDRLVRSAGDLSRLLGARQQLVAR